MRISDWSSYVCSSDLDVDVRQVPNRLVRHVVAALDDDEQVEALGEVGKDLGRLLRRRGVARADRVEHVAAAEAVPLGIRATEVGSLHPLRGDRQSSVWGRREPARVMMCSGGSL